MPPCSRAKDDSSRRITGFVESGLADGRVNRFGSYVGAGLVGSGPFSRRLTDELGVAVAIARNGPGFLRRQRRAGMATNACETAIELTYLAQIASRLAVQPDFQYVIHPDTDPLVQSARAFQLRFEMTF